MPSEQQMRESEDRGTVFVEVSKSFLQHLTKDWSQPVQVKVEGRDGDVVRFVARLVDDLS